MRGREPRIRIMRTTHVGAFDRFRSSGREWPANHRWPTVSAFLPSDVRRPAAEVCLPMLT
eukprot:5519426-Pleurochrysis_carterae.AAC.1